MNQNEKNDKWLDEIRHEMADFKKAAPASGRDRFLSAVAQRKAAASVPKKTGLLPLIYRAVAAVAVIVLSIGLWKFFPSNEELQQPADVAITPHVEMPGDREIDNGNNPEVLTSNYRHDKALEHPLTTGKVDVDTMHDEQIKTETIEESRQIKEVEETPGVFSDKDQDEIEKKLLLTADSNHKKKRSLGFGLNIGSRLANNEDISELQTGIYPWYGSEGLLNNNEDIYDMQNHHSWSFGISVNKQINERLSVESGIVYTSLISHAQTTHNRLLKQSLNYIGVPLRLNVKLLDMNRWHLYAVGGGMAERCIAAYLDGKSFSINELQWSIGAAVGGQYNLTRKVGLYLEPGVNYYFDDHSGIESQRTERPLNINLHMGLRFTY